MSIYLRSYWFAAVGHKVVADIRSSLYGSILSQEIAFFDRMRAGDLVSRLSNDCAMLQSAVSINISVIIRYGLQVLIGVVLMIFLSIKLTLAILILIPVLMIISIILGKKLRQASRKMQDALAQANGMAEESIYSMRTVKGFSNEQHELKRYGSAIERSLQFGLSRAKVGSFLQAFVSFLLNAAIVGVFGLGVYMVLQNQISVGDLTAFLLYGVIVAVSFGFLASAYTELAQSLGAAERIFEVLDRTSGLSESKSPMSIKLPVKGEVVFENVSFHYPTRPDIDVLSGINLNVKQGQTLALVGPSGAGKSTIIALLLRLYDPLRGVIRFDGVDLKELKLSELRSHIAIVPQEPELFSVSIGENLSYGKAGASEDEMLRVCKDANILDFVMNLPSGLSTHVGDRGVQLSAGQKQRIAIARAMLKNPALLLLDEATSALDSENEALVHEALKRLMSGRTTIVIAHRLATIQNADSVVVIDRGKIIQSGKHDSLRREHGLYQQLVERQELRS